MTDAQAALLELIRNPGPNKALEIWQADIDYLLDGGYVIEASAVPNGKHRTMLQLTEKGAAYLIHEAS